MNASTRRLLRRAVAMEFLPTSCCSRGENADAFHLARPGQKEKSNAVSVYLALKTLKKGRKDESIETKYINGASYAWKSTRPES